MPAQAESTPSEPAQIASESVAAEAESGEGEPVAVEAESGAAEPVAVEAEPAEASDEATGPAQQYTVSRLTVPRLALPKLSLPKFGIGRARPDEEVDAVPLASAVDAETTIAIEAIADPQAAAEAAPAVDAEPATGSEAAVDAEPVADTEPAADAGLAGEPDPEAVSAAAEESPIVEDTPVEKPNKGAAPKTGAIKVVQPKTGAVAVVAPKTGAVGVVAPKTGSIKVVAPKTGAIKVVAPKTGAVAVVAPKTKVARSNSEVVLLVEGLTKRYDDKIAVNGIDLEVKVGSFYGIVGPNGAGKTTSLSMITGLLRPDAGVVTVHGADVWSDPVVSKRNMGVLPDRLRLFDRLTGAQLLFYAGVLRGLDEATVRKRTTDLAGAFGLEEALGRLVSDYSAGMTKKVALAAAMIHSPRILVLDEPFESVDPVSAATITEILRNYAEAGGTVVLSSHSMDLVQRICDNVAVIVGGDLLADGTMAAVRNGRTLEERFVQLAGGRKNVEGLEWLHSFSD